MKAIILSAGRGKRLARAGGEGPKCLVPVQGQPLIEWQLDSLARCGIPRASVVLGYGADKVRRLLTAKRRPIRVDSRFNPFFAVADNLVSCWMARDWMNEEFVLLNGDTLFEPAVLQRLLDAPPAPVTLAVDRKSSYDADDMKVQLAGDRLLAIGKDLPPQRVDAESIGMIRFRGAGVGWFREALEQAMQDPAALGRWYLSVIGAMAERGQVRVQPVAGLDWCEVDYPLDLVRAGRMLGRWAVPRLSRAGSA